MSDTLMTPATATEYDATVVDMTKRLPAPAVPVDDTPSGARTSGPARDAKRAARRDAARAAGIRTRAAGRRWAARQRTERGHHRQIGRGLIRAHAWVIGVEGIHAHAAKHTAHAAAKDARAAARSARYTVVGRDKARQASDRQQEAARAAVEQYRKTRSAVSRARAFRAAIAYGLPALVDLFAWAESGWIGAATTAGVLGGTAFLGRRPLRAESWDPERRSIGDGDPLSDGMLNDAFRRAGIIAKDATLTMVHPCGYGRGAWQATVDLPSATAKAAMKKVAELAGELGVKAAQVSLSGGDRENRLHVWVSTSVPFTGEPLRGPLLDADKPMNLWDRLPVGTTLRGDPYYVLLPDRSGLVGGEPGAGKSAGGNNILLAAALDPHCILCLADGKGGADLQPFEGLADQFEGDADPEAFYELLGDVIEDMEQRYALLKSLGKRKISEKLCRDYPLLRLKLVWVDELMFFTTDEKWGKKITARLRNIVSRGRAAGIITFCATQKPASTVVDTTLRDLLSIRWALRCTTSDASDTVLGSKSASAGYDASDIEMDMRGAGWLYSEGSAPEKVLAYYYDDEQVDDLIERARQFREAAGTLPTSAAPFSEQLRAEGGDGIVFAVLLESYTAVGDGDADWLPGAVLLEELRSAGQAVTAERLAALVVRSEDDKKKRDWGSSRVVGYPRQLVADTAAKWLANR